ncbi:iron ABC transporter permease [Aureimonas sp. AU4]|uniref:ABC transporter permease n=1 Tax=Aureimonas sp. AU4 TaxID=1638163 RepID=UPI000705D359|nr:iron ABC transporter permease [Aureimonas sp. AU4]BAT30438.1 permease protein, ABC-type iron transporter [Aureimonas sp. AU4]
MANTTPLAASRGERTALILVALFVGLVCVLPVTRLALEAVAPGGVPGLSTAASVLSARSTWTATGTTLLTALGGTVIALLLGSAVALLVALTDVRLKGALVFAFLVPMMIPPQVAALAFAQMLGPASPLLNTLGIAPRLGAPNPAYSLGGIVAVLGVQNAPLVFLALRASLRALPRELVEAARSSGAGRWRVLRTVVLPLMTPALVAGGAISFVSAAGNFGVPALLGIPAGLSTLSTLIYQRLAGFGPAVIAEVAVLSVVVAVLAACGFLVQRVALRGRDYRLAGAPSQALAYPLGRWRLPIEIGAWSLVLLFVVAPLLALLTTSLVASYGVPLNGTSATLDNYREVLFRQDATIRAFRNSFLLAGVAALMLLVVAVPLAVLAAQRPGKLLRALNGATDLPYALPGIVLAIAAILLFLRPLPVLGFSLYNTIWIIFIAYLARFLALELRPLVAGALQMDASLDEAARMSGAGFTRRLVTIALPTLGPIAAAGAILVFMTAFNELTVSALLWSAGNETLGVAVFNLDDAGRSTLAAALATSTVAVILAIMLVTTLFGRRLPPGVLPWAR